MTHFSRFLLGGGGGSRLTAILVGGAEGRRGTLIKEDGVNMRAARNIKGSGLGYGVLETGDSLSLSELSLLLEDLRRFILSHPAEEDRHLLSNTVCLKIF